jgi:hypothetical protein
MMAKALWSVCASFALASAAPEGRASLASGDNPSPKASTPAGGKGTLRLRGQLVEGGVECQRFRASDGKYYTLVGDLKGLRNGDAVEIEGTVAEISSCMQDTTVQVQKVAKLKSQH